MASSTTPAEETTPERTEIMRDTKWGSHDPYPIAYTNPEIRSPYGLIRTLAKDRPDAEFLGHREYLADGTRGRFVWQSHAEILARSKRTSVALRRAWGIAKGSTVALVSQPREDWHVLCCACSMQRLVFCPLFNGYGPEALAELLRHSDAAVVFSDPACLAAVAAAAALVEPRPKVVALDSHEPERAALLSRPQPRGYDILQSDLERLGEECESQELDPAEPFDDALLLYTSGTTGTPKGVVLSQTAAISGSIALVERIPDIVWQLLPLSHVFGIGIDMAAMKAGGKVGYFSGDTRKITEDIAELRPSVMAGVPRVYQRIHAGILAQVAAMPAWKRAAFNAAYAWRKSWLCAGYLGPGVADWLVFNEIRKKFGGNVVVMICGGAPLDPVIAEFFRVCITDLFLEGWGMTETSAWGMCRDGNVDPMSFGHCGIPYCMCEVVLESVPALGYSAVGTPCRGELLVRGPSCFTRYHKNPELTRQVVDSDGFVHTGDIVERTAKGYLAVIDRKKALFKLSQGEYVSPETVERVISQSPFVQDVFVHGDSLKNFPVAVVVPKKDALCEWAATQNGIVEIAADFAQLCNDPRVNAFLLSEISRCSNEAGLHGYEKVKAVLVDNVSFESGDRGFVSPSLKLRREVIRKFYERQLEELYASEAYLRAAAAANTPSL